MDHTNIVYRTLIFERWYFFVEKSILSMWNNDYMKNKDKYIKKYGLKYKDNEVKKVRFDLD